MHAGTLRMPTAGYICCLHASAASEFLPNRRGRPSALADMTDLITGRVSK